LLLARLSTVPGPDRRTEGGRNEIENIRAPSRSGNVVYRTRFASTFRPSYSLPWGFRRGARPGLPAITKHKVTLKLLSLWSAFLEFRLKRARARHEKNPSEMASVKLARAFLRLSQPAAALSIAQQAKKRFPESRAVKEIYQEARRGRATILLQETTEMLKRSQDVELYIKASELCRTLGDLEEAFAYIYEAKRLFPEHWGIHLCLGKLYFQRFNSTRQQADGVECKKHLQRARELNPGSAKPVLYLALTLVTLGSPDEALRIIDSVPRTHAEYARVASLRAVIERSLAGRDAAGEPMTERMAVLARMESREGPGVGDAATAWRERLAATEGMLGYFLLDGAGEVIDSLTRSTDRFDFTSSIEGLRAMAAGCRHESGRIGMGSLISCTISGDAWQVCLRAIGPMSLVAFFDDRMGSEDLENLVDEILVQDQMTCEGQGCARS